MENDCCSCVSGLLHYGMWLVAVPAANGGAFSNAFWKIPFMKRAGLVQSFVNLALAAESGGCRYHGNFPRNAIPESPPDRLLRRRENG